MNDLRQAVERLITEQVAALGRNDLFRAPLFACSRADDARYPALKTVVGPWHKDPAELLPGARSVLSYFVPFTRAVASAPRAAAGAAPLWGEAYIVINEQFDRIGEAVSALLRSRGYAALPIQGTHTYDPKDLKSSWSHRSAAAIGGLGTFGANRLLLTAKGSAGRFCTVLTDAPLPPGCAATPPQCLWDGGRRCGLCFRACPVGALRPDGFDRFVCYGELLKNAEQLRDIGFCDVCGKCIAACPLAYID